MAENKVQFGLKNVHYAILTESVSSGVVQYSYSTPVSIPGAVSLSMDAQAEMSKFYADNTVYYQTSSNNGYEGDLEMARFPDKMLEEVWGTIINTTDKTLLETASAEAKAFALLFQIDGDKDKQMYVLYNCTAAKPSFSAETTTENKEPKTQSTTISAVPRADGKVMCRTTGETPSDVKNGWFTAVYEPKNT